MSHQKIPSQLNFGSEVIPKHKALNALDDLEKIINWQKMEKICFKVYSNKAGRPSYPLLVLLKALLLGAWYNLSDSKLEEQLARDLLFRKFCHLDLNLSVPDQTTLSRFRSKLSEKHLWKKLLRESKRQLSAQNILLQEGQVSIIDATVIEAHQSRKNKDKNGDNTQDPDAAWNVKNDSKGKQKITYGYKLHTNCDEDGFILSQEVSPSRDQELGSRKRLSQSSADRISAQ